MFGGYFYHQRIRKAVAVFGSLFNDINIVRKNSSGNVISQVKVPLSYAPKRDFLTRLDAMQNGEEGERQIAVKLPRMSFEIISMSYDQQRQLPKTNFCVNYNTDPSTANRIYVPVPYIVSFQLSIYAKSQDDALQIVEQILPYFTPNYTVTVKPLENTEIREDTPITMTGITFSDDFEAPLEARRTIIYTLDFDMKIQLYKDTGSGIGVIDQACVNLLNLDDPDELFSRVCTDSAFTASHLSGTTVEDTALTRNFTVSNVPSNITSFETSDPLHGTASATLVNVLTNINGIIEATGTWTYTPDADYYGVDTFDLTIVGDFGSKTFPISLTVTPVEDALDYNITVELNTPTEIPLDGNLFSGDVTYIVELTGEPTNGTVEVTDSANGVFEYTPNLNYTGSDSFTYRATPIEGTPETGVINIDVIVIPEVMGDQTGQIVVTESGDILEL